MQKIKIIFLLLFSLLLMGCQSNSGQPDKLDTTHLEKDQAIGLDGLTKSQRNSIPISYTARSTEIALKALPFKMSVPQKLPFVSKGFTNISIEDYKHNGKEIDVKFIAFSKNPEIFLMLDANNHNAEYVGPNQTVKLKNGVKGKYGVRAIIFRKTGINYGITLQDPALTPSKLKRALIDLANQMIID